VAIRKSGDGFLKTRAGGFAALGFCFVGSVQAQGVLNFAAQQTFAVGTGPHAVASADLNADGKRDVIVTNQGSASVSVLLNTTAAGAAPTFAAQVSLTTGSDPVAVAIADINGDGKPDLIVANAQSGSISVLLNTTTAGATTPTFAAQQTFTAGGYPFSVAAADLDGDGKPDIVIANAGSSGVSILRNTTTAGATTASFAATQFVATGKEAAAVVVADIDSDGKPDLVVANYTSNTTSVLLNTTAAGATTLSFGAQTALIGGSAPSAVAVADLNGDNKPDVVIVNSFDYTVSVLLNTTAAGAAAASFTTQQTFLTGVGPAAIAIADVDGDGRPDLIVSNQGDATVSVLLNTMAANAAVPTFAARQNFTVGKDPVGVIAADVQNDGKADLIAANNQDATLSVLQNTTLFTGVNLDQHGITGSWFNLATGGQGLEIELYPDLGASGQGLLFAGWFTYDVSASGGQRWYSLQGAVNNTSPFAQLGIYAGYGGNFAAGPVIAATQVGVATLRFSDCTTGTLTYSFYDGRTGTIPLTRLTANVTCGTTGDNGTAPSDYLLSGSWFQADIGGQGLIFDVNPAQNVFFAAWYTYTPTGQQTGGGASERWYVIQAAFAPGAKSISGAPIYTDAGGAFNALPAPTPAPVGTANITFTSCGAATLAYTFTAGANAGLSGTLNLSRTGPVPAGCSL